MSVLQFTDTEFAYILIHIHILLYKEETRERKKIIDMANLTTDFDFDAALAPNTTEAGSPIGSLVKIKVVSAVGLKNTEQFGGIPDPYVEFSQFSGFCLYGATARDPGLSKKCRGRNVDNTVDPTWNQDFYFVCSKDTTRCKLKVMDWNGGGLMASNFIASTTILFDQCEGKVSQKIFPQGEITYEYVRCPINIALAEEGKSNDDWKNIALHQTKAKKLIMVNVQSVQNIGKNKNAFVEVDSFMDLKGHKIRVSGGNKKGSEGKESVTETVKTNGDGNATFNQAFLFLAEPGVQACELTIKTKGMVTNSTFGKLTLGLEQQKVTGTLKVKDGSVSIQTTCVDLDIGVMGLINSKKRAEREAELKAIAEREAAEREEQRKAAEAAAAALLAAQKAEAEAAAARKKAEEDEALRKEAEEKEAAAKAAREEAERKQAEEDKLWQNKVKKMVAAAGVATAAAFAATCMYGSWGIDRVNESLEDLQKRASDYLDGNPKAAAAVDQSRAKAQQLAEQANVLADKGVKALNKASEKAGKMFKKLW